MGLTNISLRGFFRTPTLASKMINRAPKLVMNMGTLVNAAVARPAPRMPASPRILEHMNTHGAWGMKVRSMPKAMNLTVGFSKTKGMMPNHLGASGDLAIAASMNRHVSTI